MMIGPFSCQRVFLPPAFIGECLSVKVFLVDTERLLCLAHGVEVPAEIGDPTFERGLTVGAANGGRTDHLGSSPPEILYLHRILEPLPANNQGDPPIGISTVVSHLKKIPFASLQCLTSKAEPLP
jgi:hypothetical protein